MRFDDCTSPETIIKYMTDGMLMREYLVDGQWAGQGRGGGGGPVCLAVCLPVCLIVFMDGWVDG